MSRYCGSLQRDYLQCLIVFQSRDRMRVLATVRVWLGGSLSYSFPFPIALSLSHTFLIAFISAPISYLIII